MRVLGLLALCAASSAQPTITLRYFDIRGLAEPIRLTLAALGLEWEEIKYARCPDGGCPAGVTDWNAAKEEGVQSGSLPFGQVPSMTYVDGSTGHHFEMVQSLAILRFLARRHDFYGISEEEHVLIDVAVGGVGDMRQKYGELAYDPDVHTNPELLRAYKGDYLPKWLGYLERLLQRAGGSYFGGSSFSFADTMVFDIIDHNQRVDPACLAPFPTLQQFMGSIGHKHGVWEYVSDPARRRAFANGANAAYDTPNHAPAGVGFAPPPKETKGEL